MLTWSACTDLMRFFLKSNTTFAKQSHYKVLFICEGLGLGSYWCAFTMSRVFSSMCDNKTNSAIVHPWLFWNLAFISTSRKEAAISCTLKQFLSILIDLQNSTIYIQVQLRFKDSHECNYLLWPSFT